MDRIAQSLTGVSSRLSRATLIGAILILAAMMLSGAVSFGYNYLLKQSRAAVDHTFQVLSKIDATLLRLQDAETGQRGFIITGDEAYLAPFAAAETQVSGELSELDGLVSDNAEQRLRIGSLRQLAAQKFGELNATIETRRKQGIEAARLSVLRSSGKQMMDRIRAITGEMRDKEHALLAARLSNLNWAEGLMFLVAVIGVALSLGGRLIAAYVRTRFTTSEA